jgi:hypothetical protein
MVRAIAEIRVVRAARRALLPPHREPLSRGLCWHPQALQTPACAPFT